MPRSRASDDLDEAVAGLGGEVFERVEDTPPASKKASKAKPTRRRMLDLIAQIVDIDKAIEDTGLQRLLEKKSELRDELKCAMAATSTERLAHEAIGQSAALVPSYSDEWDVGATRQALTELKVAKGRFPIVEMVDVRAMRALIERSQVTRAALERRGAVKKRLRSVALHVRPIVEE
jgi:hypothetical protein